MKKRIKGIGIILVAILMLVSMISCGSMNKSESDDSYEEAKMKVGNSTKSTNYGSSDKSFNKNQADESGTEITSTAQVERKIIKRESLTVQTLNFDKDKDALLKRVEESLGYIESSEVSGKGIDEQRSRRYARFVFRIPKEKYKSFKEDIEAFAHIVRQEVNTSDVTLEFFDTEARVKTLLIQEERLLEILKKSGEIKDIIEIEKALQDVRYEIERNTTTLKRLTNLVNYVTVNVYLDEVRIIEKVVEEPESFGDKIVREFKRSARNVKYFLNDSIIWLIGIIPYMVIIVPFGFIMILILKKLRKKTVQYNEEVDKKEKENKE